MMTASHLLWITPLVPLAIGAGMLLVRDRRLLAALDVGGSAVVLGLALSIARRVAGQGAVSALGTFRADSVAVIFLLLVGLLSLSVSVATVGWMKREGVGGRVGAVRLRA